MLVFVIAAMAVVCALAVRASMRAVRDRREQLEWEDLVARHRELDRELDTIWQHW